LWVKFQLVSGQSAELSENRGGAVLVFNEVHKVVWSLFLILACFSLASGDLSAQCTPASWVISGVVVDSNGQGVGGVDIDITQLSTGQPMTLSQDFSLANGSFSLAICQSVPSGFFDITFQVAATDPLFDRTLQTVTLSGNTNLGTIELLDAGIVAGRVVTELGQPLELVDLDFYDPISGQPTPFSGDTTDAAGEFAVKVSRAFWDVRFVADPSSSSVPLVPVMLSDLALFFLVDVGDVVLRNGYTLTGTVLDLGGSPVVAGDIDVRDPDTGEKILTPGDNTNGSGIFSVLAPSGDFQLEIDPPQGSPLVSSLMPISIPVGGANLGVLVLPDGFSVSGEVLNSSGQSVPETDLDFYISATGVEIPTAHDNANSSGVFSVQVVPDTYDIAFRPRFSSGAAPLVIEAVLVASNVDLGSVVVPDGFAITGTVVAGVTPVGEVEITLIDSNTGVPAYVHGNDTDGLGAFALRQVAGTYDVTATPLPGSGLNPVTIDAVLVNSDQNLVIDLLGGGPSTPPDPIEALDCTLNAGSVQLSWTLGNLDYDQLQISLDGVLLVDLPGSATSYVDVLAPQSLLDYSVVAIRDVLTSFPISCQVDNSPVVTAPPPVEALTCVADPGGVNLSWILGASDYDLIQVIRNGVFVANLSGFVTQYTDIFAPQDLLEYTFVAIRSGLESTPSTCIYDNSPASTPPSPVNNLTCVDDPSGVQISWINGDLDYDEIEIYRDGSLLSILPGQGVSFLDTSAAPGTREFVLLALRDGFESDPASCIVVVGSPAPIFVRGDANQDQILNLGDVITTLDYLFVTGIAPICPDAVDSNDSGNINIADAISVLGYLFSGGVPPAPPFPTPGPDPTADSLTCF
jgi:hypothetical protein